MLSTLLGMYVIIRDEYSLLLYIVGLCGHYAIVKYLLENGAQCDRNAFQG